MLLRIHKYYFQIKYVPGKGLGLADSLSRVHPCPSDTIKDLDIYVHEMRLHFNVSPTRIEQICEGWPERQSGCPPNLHNYWNYKDELSSSDGLIM